MKLNGEGCRKCETSQISGTLEQIFNKMGAQL